mmetsp:Transcript_43107/g.77453  ORF Transcript_43107/g.77453 Transcript_43107/m.77453 type:complete len:302 (+) Transcript_43107:503-1408(+)
MWIYRRQPHAGADMWLFRMAHTWRQYPHEVKLYFYLLFTPQLSLHVSWTTVSSRQAHGWFALCGPSHSQGGARWVLGWDQDRLWQRSEPGSRCTRIRQARGASKARHSCCPQIWRSAVASHHVVMTDHEGSLTMRLPFILTRQQHAHRFTVKNAILSRAQVRWQFQIPKTVPVQSCDVVPNCSKHSTNLVVPPFSQGDVRRCVRQGLQYRWAAGTILALQQQLPTAEDSRLIPCQWPVQSHKITFGHLMLWARELVQELPVIGKYQKARGVLVETPNRGDCWLPRLPTLRQETIDQLTLLL